MPEIRPDSGISTRYSSPTSQQSALGHQPNRSGRSLTAESFYHSKTPRERPMMVGTWNVAPSKEPKMSIQLAVFFCTVGVAFFFYLNRVKAVRTSKGLWVAVIWLGLTGSRPVSMWLGMTPPSSSRKHRRKPRRCSGIWSASGHRFDGPHCSMREDLRYLPVIGPVSLTLSIA